MADKDIPITTYGDLLAALQSLTPEQLQQRVTWWGEERGGRIVRVDVLECEHTNVGGDGHEARTAYADDPETWENDATNILPAGTVLLADERYPWDDDTPPASDR